MRIALCNGYEMKFENYDFISGYCHSYGVNKILQKP